MERRIGLGGAVFTLVGYVVGASIFILPGELAATTGPGVCLAFLVAAVPAFFTCVISAQIGSMFPTSGATYVAVRTALSPFWGFMLVWTIIVSATIAIPFVAYGFADYLNYFVPGMPPMPVAAMTVVGFGVLNLAGVRLIVWLQALLVSWFLVTLLGFGIGGLLHADPANWRPLFPEGKSAILIAAIPAYLSYSGLAVIAELGEEIKNPRRTIPLCLFISFAIILLVYTLVPLALTGLIAWTELGTTEAVVGRAAEMFMPKWLASVVAVSALAAAATSINGILLAQSRDIFALARDRIVPPAFGRISPRSGGPNLAVLLLTGMSLLGVLYGRSITEYAIMTVQGVMFLQILAGLAVFRLPKLMPQEFADSPSPLSPAVHNMFCVGLVVVSALFILVGAVESPRSTGVMLALVAVGAVYYAVRRRVLDARDVRLKDTLP